MDLDVKLIKVSIIIPVYNCEKYLSDCLNGIIGARLKSFEIILVDDGSTDGSLEIAKQFESRFPFIRAFTQPNSGPSKARNLGIDAAEGKYIIFFDSDDRIAPLAFHHRIELLDRYEADIWASDFHRAADNGVIMDRVYQIRPTDAPITDISYLLDFLSAPDCVWNVWRYIFKRDFLQRNGLRFAEGFSCGEDLEFVVRALMCAGAVSFLHEPYYSYRVNYGATLTRRYTAARTEQLMAMLSRAWEYLDKTDRPEARVLQGKISREYILSLSLYADCGAKERAGVLAALNEQLPLMSTVSGKAYKAVAGSVRLLGVPVAGSCLYLLKTLKRTVRKTKARRATNES